MGVAEGLPHIVELNAVSGVSVDVVEGGLLRYARLRRTAPADRWEEAESVTLSGEMLAAMVSAGTLLLRSPEVLEKVSEALNGKAG